MLTWLPILLGILAFAATSCEDRAEKAPSAETASSAPAKPGAPASAAGYDATITGNAERMMEEGQQTFRFDTFGSEAFFGDALQLHKAVAGEQQGGVGPGVSPKPALSVGLKVDADPSPLT